MSEVGNLGHALARCRRMIADSATFRAWATAADQEQALARIHLDNLPLPDCGDREYEQEELNRYRPYAVAEHGRDDYHERRAAERTWDWEASVRVLFEKQVPPGRTAQENAREGRELIDGMLIDFRSLIAGDTGGLYLHYQDIDVLGPERAMREELPAKGDFYQIYMVFLLER